MSPLRLTLSAKTACYRRGAVRQAERDTRKNMNIRLGRDMTCERGERERKRQRQVDFTANFTLNNNINCPSMEHKRRKEGGSMRPYKIEQKRAGSPSPFIARSVEMSAHN